MSTFWQPTKHPETGEWHNAVWMDDYFRHHHYAAGFADGLLVDPEQIDLSSLPSRHCPDVDKMPKAKTEDFYPKGKHVRKWENEYFKYWTTADGQKIRVTHLQRDHLENIIKDGYMNPVIVREAKKRSIDVPDRD